MLRKNLDGIKATIMLKCPQEIKRWGFDLFKKQVYGNFLWGRWLSEQSKPNILAYPYLKPDVIRYFRKQNDIRFLS